MTQPALFDVDRLTPKACPVPGCQSIRLPGQKPPIVSCAHDLEHERRYRPKGCLNTWDDTANPFPDNY